MSLSLVYISEQGSVVKKSGGRLQVTKGGEVLADFPVRMLRCLVIFGNVQLTTQAISALLDHGADVSFLTMNGRLKGRLTGCLSKNIFVRMAQHARWRDQEYRLAIARCIVRGKLVNLLEQLRHFRRLRPDLDVAEAKDRLSLAVEQAGKKQTLAELMGAEGAASALYFRFFGRMLKEGSGFSGRRMHPSTDPANALLSLGYCLVTNELASLLESASLDPYIGFLHGIKYGRRALSFDLVEEFRQPLVDRLTLRLLNQKVLQAGDFTDSGHGILHLNQDPFRRYLAFYEENLRREKNGRSWRDLFRRQVERLATAVLEGTVYQPFPLEETG